ncbi:MAG: response regulator transcription factor [Verrucomicrobiota bacterium]
MKKILIVEDDQKIACALNVRLTANGYDVITAFDAMAGVSLVLKQAPDLVILDISIPAGSGFDVADRIRSLPRMAGTPLVFITASRKPEFRARAEQLGAAGYIEKPFDDDELIAVIRRALHEAPRGEGAPPGLRPGEVGTEQKTPAAPPPRSPQDARAALLEMLSRKQTPGKQGKP